MEYYQGSTQMPRQKLPFSKKDEEWQHRNIDGALTIVSIYNNSRRTTKFKKKINYDLYNGKLNKKDLEYVVNPLGVTGVEFPANIQPYDVWSPTFNFLFGEEGKRGLNFIVRAINEEAITEKEEGKKAEVMKYLNDLLLHQTLIKEPEQAKQAIEPKLEDYNYYNYQDMREKTATDILNYLRRDLNLDSIFQKGWEDVLLAGEEIYAIEGFAGEPSVRRVNPMECYFLIPHNSDFMDDAEVIVEDSYMSFSKIVDTFYDKLTEAQIEQIEMMNNGSSSGAYNHIEEVQFIQSDQYYNTYTSGMFDAKGNIRVVKVTWKSKRKIGELTFIDEFGEQQVTIVDETYKVDKKNPNESVKWMWVNQYWEGYKIGNELYFGIQPKKLQFRRMTNLSKCKSGYVGTIYNANNAQSVSLMDRLLPWIYLFITIAYNTELAIATNLGKIAMIDLSLIPDGWEPEKWMYYAKTLKFGFVDGFNEGKKGMSTGKLAGNITDHNKVLDLETGNYIQQHIGLLEYIEGKIEDLSGVTRQRKGQTTATDAVGTTQQSIIQSSTITEKWFQIHNWTKQRVLECLVEVAKDAWKDNNKKVQYVLDDMSIAFLNVDGEQFNDAEYGVFVSNSTKDIQGIEALKSMTQAAMQNDKMNLSDIATLFMSDSLAEIRANLRKTEANAQKQANSAQEAQFKHEQNIFDKQMQMEAFKQDNENARNKENNETKIYVAEVGALSFSENKDTNNNNVPDVLEVEKLRADTIMKQDKLNVEREKINSTLKIHNDTLNKERQEHKDNIRLKEKEIEAKKQIAKNKPKPNK